MKKIYLLKVVQDNSVHYLGCADPRTLVRMSKKAEMNAVQDAQRPIEPKRLEEISSFVQSGGTLSTSLVLGTTDDRIRVCLIEEFPEAGELYYTEFPETEPEFAKMQNVFELMDGQHRLFSFLPEYCKIAKDTPYAVSFELYLTPTMREKRLIFKNTNEKQKSVAPNLLMWFRDKLGLLTDRERAYHRVVSLLNEESCSPLRGRIIMGAERIIGGIKASQLIQVMHKAAIKSITQPPLDDEKLLALISNYLIGWEQAVGSKMAQRENDLGSFSKMAGLRYMLNLLPTFYSLAIEERKKFNTEYVCAKVERLYSELADITPREFFDRNSDFNKEKTENPFSSETATLELAKEHAAVLKGTSEQSFDPLA